jgi:sodium-dependent phosphate cotransporter
MKNALVALKFCALLYVFFLCIELLGGSIKLFGEEAVVHLMDATNNPFVGLFMGILTTSIIQSSSTTTALVVGMVGGGTLSISQAIPIIMGANIGTTVTNSIVSMGYVRRRKEFAQAFSGAILHDFFNLLGVTVFLPLEIAFHPIQYIASFISSSLIGLEGVHFHSPINVIVHPVVVCLHEIGAKFVSSNTVLGIVMIVFALVLLIFALSRIVKLMHGALAKKIELVVDRYLFTGIFRSLVIGIVITAVVQSSSATTSVVIPLLGAGIVRLETVYPYMVGANIGTTITALLASLVTGVPAAVTVAFCHLVFNTFAASLWLPLRFVPIWLARVLAKATAKRRWIAPVYVLVLFFIIPGILILIG